MYNFTSEKGGAEESVPLTIPSSGLRYSLFHRVCFHYIKLIAESRLESVVGSRIMLFNYAPSFEADK